MADLYDLFRQRLADTAQNRFDAVMASAKTAQTANAATTKFRRDYFDKLMAGVKSGFNEFQHAVSESLVRAVQGRNPYAAWNGDRITVFPDGCKFWYRGANACVCVIQEPPQQRTLFFDRKYYARDTYRLSLPYTIFVIVFQYLGKGLTKEDEWSVYKVQAGFMNKPLTDPNKDILGEVPLPDHKGMEICMGRSWSSPMKKPPAEAAHEVVHYYWNSVFRQEWMDNCSNMSNIQPAVWGPENDPAIWEKTYPSPLDIMSVRWHPGKSIMNTISRTAAEFKDLLPSGEYATIVQDAVAAAWESMRERMIPTGEGLDAAFSSAMTTAVRSALATVVAEVVTGMDNELVRVRKKAQDDLVAAGSRQTTFSVCPQCLVRDDRVAR